MTLRKPAFLGLGPDKLMSMEGHSASRAGQVRTVRLTIPAKAEYITLGRLALTALAGCGRSRTRRSHDLKLA